MTRREATSAVLFLIALALYVTWPQARHLRDAVVWHDDPFFSMWRLAWIGHALRVAPHHLYDANIFFPDARTLAYSDATLLEGALAAPFLWLGASPVTVYNVLLIAGIAGSGIGMLVLVQHLTGNSRAALVAATIFTLVPYRIEHVMHLELEWTAWMPLALWSLHRTYETRSPWWGALTGVLVWLQVLSCVYYGVFLALAVSVFALTLLAVDRTEAGRKILAGAVGPAIAVPLTIVYAQPYIENARSLGPRPAEEVARFSATLLSYASAPAQNWLWGATADRFGGNELHLFPGLVAVALAAGAFAARRRRPLVIAYATLALFAVLMSFGPNAPLYPWLRAHLFVLSGLRAAARFSIVGFAAMAVLAGIGFERLAARSISARTGPLMIACLVAIALECGSAPLQLTTIGRVPDVYVMLRQLPPAPVVEFPAAEPSWLPGYDPIYMFWSTTHWRPLVNGYSGYVSSQYVARLEKLQEFPARAAVDRLGALGVRYVIVHEALYSAAELPAVLLGIARNGALTPIGSYRDSTGRAQLFEIRGSPQR